jgi:hypothetical protein
MRALDSGGYAATRRGAARGPGGNPRHGAPPSPCTTQVRGGPSTGMPMRHLWGTLSLIGVCLLSAGAGPAVTPPARAAPHGASFLHALANAAYPVEGTRTGTAPLTDGVFEEPAAPGSAATTTVRLGHERAVGDLNGDGAEDAAVTLVVDPGGSGTFTYLALIHNDQGAARPVASVRLGDRVRVQSLAIRSGRVVVTMLTRQPTAPMSAAPDVRVTRTFRLLGDQVVEGP